MRPFDKLIDPPLDRVAAQFVRFGVGAHAIIIVGLVAGLAAAVAIAAHFYLAGLALLAVNLLLTGLSAPVARLTKVTELSDFLAIVFEFIVTASVPFAFALADPSRALAANFLLLGLLVCGSTSLSHKVLVPRSKIAADVPGPLSIHGLGATAGRGAIFLGFAIACLKQDWFSLVAYVLGVLSFAAAGTWVVAAVTDFNS